jgi:hypothetical protein
MSISKAIRRLILEKASAIGHVKKQKKETLNMKRKGNGERKKGFKKLTKTKSSK